MEPVQNWRSSQLGISDSLLISPLVTRTKQPQPSHIIHCHQLQAEYSIYMAQIKLAMMTHPFPVASKLPTKQLHTFSYILLLFPVWNLKVCYRVLLVVNCLVTQFL